MFRHGKRKLLEFGVILIIFAALSIGADSLIAGYGVYLFIFLAVIYLLYNLYVANFNTQQLIRDRAWENEKSNEAWQSIHRYVSFKYPLPQLSSYAAAPDFAQYVLAHIMKHRPAVIYELGCGFSTLIISKTIDTYSKHSKLFSLEADEYYLDKCRESIQQEELTQYVSFTHAPYVSVKLNERDWHYYRLPQIDHKIDLLIVDGPPKSLQKNSRYPALHFFKQHLATDGFILCDDAARDDMKETINTWNNEHPDMIFESIHLTRGASLIYFKK